MLPACASWHSGYLRCVAVGLTTLYRDLGMMYVPQRCGGNVDTRSAAHLDSCVGLLICIHHKQSSKDDTTPEVLFGKGPSILKCLTQPAEHITARSTAASPTAKVFSTFSCTGKLMLPLRLCTTACTGCGQPGAHLQVFCCYVVWSASCVT